MTSPSSASFGTDEHPEVAEISALAEGLLPPERSADVRAHLSDCDLCADVQVSLEEIRSALGTLPGPVRMPSDVAGRIDAALAAEALLDATAPDSGPASDEDRTDGRDRSPEGEPAAVSRETPAARVVSRETTSAGRSSTRPAGHARGAGGPGRSARRSRRWRTALLGTAGAAALIAFGALLLPELQAGSSGARTDSGVASDSTSRSETGVADEALEARIRSLLADGGTSGKPKQGPEKAGPDDTPEFTTKASPNAPLSTGTPTMPSCVREGIDRDEVPLAVDKDVYEGRQAYIVVLPHGSDGTRVDAYVVDADCVGKTPSEPGTVLATRTYAR
ncbi:hypothetical protein [Streptomyces macrosporus]|uniref:Zinc-finger domain-containing protein n=1 Tax=Streptomyces macrosporus TaxID=44032 RepID=A0ABN3KMI2_9ACTN